MCTCRDKTRNVQLNSSGIRDFLSEKDFNQTNIFFNLVEGSYKFLPVSVQVEKVLRIFQCNKLIILRKPLGMPGLPTTFMSRVLRKYALYTISKSQIISFSLKKCTYKVGAKLTSISAFSAQKRC